MKIFLPIIPIICLFFSCAPSLFDQMATNNKDPKNSRPDIKSFEIAHSIVCSWKEDIGAEEYILYRYINTNGGFTKEVYTEFKFKHSGWVTRSRGLWHGRGRRAYRWMESQRG